MSGCDQIHIRDTHLNGIDQGSNRILPPSTSKQFMFQKHTNVHCTYNNIQ